MFWQNIVDILTNSISLDSIRHMENLSLGDENHG